MTNFLVECHNTSRSGKPMSPFRYLNKILWGNLESVERIEGDLCDAIVHGKSYQFPGELFDQLAPLVGKCIVIAYIDRWAVGVLDKRGEGRGMKPCIRCNRVLTTKNIGTWRPGQGLQCARCGPNADLRQWEARSCTP